MECVVCSPTGCDMRLVDLRTVPFGEKWIVRVGRSMVQGFSEVSCEERDLLAEGVSVE